MVVTKQYIGFQIAAAVLLASILAVVTRVDAPAAVQIPLGLLVAFFVPGLIGFRAIRGHSPRTLIDAAMSLVGSVGILIALGIVLDLLPPGLTPETWSLGLLVVTTLLALAAVLRHGITSDAARPEADALPERTGSDRRSWIRNMALALMSAVLLGVATTTTLNSQRAENADQRLTELWLAGDRETQIVHVVNREGSPMTYRVAVTVQGRRRTIEEFRLADGAEWVTSVNLPQRRREGRGAPVLAVSLYRGDGDAAYREVHVGWPGP